MASLISQSTSEKCAAVTAAIIEQIEAGTPPWVRPWSSTAASGLPHNFATKRPYNGANVLNLWMTQSAFGYPTAEWATFKQAQSLGGRVRKGEHGTPAFYISTFAREENVNGESVARRIPLLKCFTVFNVAQIDGLPLAPAPEVPPEPERLVNVDAYLGAIGAEVRTGGDHAFYSPGSDFIQLPAACQFESMGAYYATSLHEHGHWTGSAHRLARTFGKRFGDEAYAFEELVAELTAAFLCAELKIPGRLRHPEYIANWVRVLRTDAKAIWTAGSRATEAANFLNDAAGTATDERQEIAA